MEDEFNPITGKHIAIGLIAAAVGWGSLWAATNDARLAFGPDNDAAFTQVASSKTAADNEASNGSGHAERFDVPGQSKSREDTTDSVSAAPTPSPSPTVPPKTITVMMGGDVMLDRGIRAIGETKSYGSLFTSIAALFKTADVAVVNLEGPITSNKSKTYIHGKPIGEFAFTFDPGTAAIMKKNGITAVSLANNHTSNFGPGGLAETHKWLTKAGVGIFGDPFNHSGTEWTTVQNGISLAFVGYHEFEKGFENIIADVTRLKNAGYFVIAMPHWGIEYETTMNASIHEKARALVAAGADAVIGSHPHVISDHEWFGNVPVFYSLGNLVFDQYFSPEVMKGNILSLHIEKGDGPARLKSIDVYETSTASKKTVSVGESPAYSEKAPK